MILPLVGVLALVFGVGAGEEPARAGPARRVEIPGARLEMARGRFGKPSVISSAAELARAFPEEDTQKKIEKQVDFKRHQLFYFAWSGSGQDRVAVREEQGKVVFAFTPGRTRDLRAHHHLFAVPKGTAWSVSGGR
jgi:hypothetical protein